ncbi:winged helix-turn-helix domain-containing protein [Streptomyces sioyaensis]|uniref:winged helix-turn-helix domain-containing protein n=1 Tax=Streptomyces sioyaensis TaxID=67364 RepID=UPI0036DFB4BF
MSMRIRQQRKSVGRSTGAAQRQAEVTRSTGSVSPNAISSSAMSPVLWGTRITPSMPRSHPVGPGPESARAFHVSYSVSGATRLMHRFDFSPQAPAPPSTMSRLSPRGKTRPGPR